MKEKEILFEILGYRIAEIDESLMPLIIFSMNKYYEDTKRDELLKFTEWMTGDIFPDKNKDIVDKYLNNNGSL